MNLKDFEAATPRPLPVFILADTSGSMQGEKIQALNVALREMVNSLAMIEDIRGLFQIAIITFGQKAQLHQPLQNVNLISLTEMEAQGKTPMGAAFEMVADIIEDKEQVPPRAYTPLIILVSDGQPTDYDGHSNASTAEYLEWDALKRLHAQNTRASKCQRLAMGIGGDADYAMLEAFINDSNCRVIKAKEAAEIGKFFRWITMSTVSRIQSAHPNDPIRQFESEWEDPEIPL